MQEAAYRIGIDTGGTFTDFVLLNESDGSFTTLKTLSTPPEFSRGVVSGLKKLNVDLSQVRYIVYGTTIGVNALIERRGAKTGLLTTRGFEDILNIQRMNKPEMYNLFYRKPTPLVPRSLRVGIEERVDGRGNVLQRVDPTQVRRGMRRLVARGITAVAICTINSYLNSENEQAIYEVVRDEFPELFVSVSYQLIRQRREFERTSTTVLNAYIAAPMMRLLEEIQQELDHGGFHGTFLVMKSNGGVMTLENAKLMPVHTLLSGPVGGSVALATLGRKLAADRLIGFDMGGTSSDISVVIQGKPQMSSNIMVEGHPVMTPMVNTETIGSGGGSIASVEGLTSLRVGPRSAGSNPGPASYSRGGLLPTVTDANLVLGRLDPDMPLADDIVLNREAAREAIGEYVAKKLDMTVEEAALAMIRIANVKMAYAIRGVTIRKGLDPREFSLVPFGGAGPLHAAEVAAQVGVRRTIIPRAPGNFSAWGMLNTDLRHDVVRTIDLEGDISDLPELQGALDEMESRGLAVLMRHGIGSGRPILAPAVDVRYKGQMHTLTVPLNGERVDEAAFDSLLQDFHRLHEQNYGHSSPRDPVEFVALRLELTGQINKPGYYHFSTNGGPHIVRAREERQVIFESGSQTTPIFDRNSFFPGFELVGPAVINERGSTVLLPPAYKLLVDAYGNLLIETPGEVAQ